jgi:hypothetical protein
MGEPPRLVRDHFGVNEGSRGSGCFTMGRRMRCMSRMVSSVATAIIVIGAMVAGAAHEGRSQQAKASDTQPLIKVSVFSGNEVRIGRLYTVLADCSSGPRPDTRVVTPPANGTVRVEAAQLPADVSAGSLRAHCSGKLIDGTRVTYKSNDGFIGEDKVTIDVDYKTGTVRRLNWTIDVR